jgi:hypothetical protein
MKIVLKINTAYGKIGDTVIVGNARGDHLIKTGQAEPADEAPSTRIENKAMGVARGPGRPRKVTA